MRLNAYVLAGDPAWIPQSIASYYGLVDRIVVSYDRAGRSWAGHPLSVKPSLERLRRADPDGKMVFLPGDHADPHRFTLDVETEQRQGALDAASEGADWVLQLDTDEIVAAPRTFVAQIDAAVRHGADALDYPSRIVYTRSPSGVFLEVCGRWWTTQAGFPGPLAVRAGTTLTHARQAAHAPTYRVDLAPWNTDPAHPRDAHVHAVVPASEAVLHLSWVRTEAQMAEKSVVSGYAASQDWNRELARWRRRTAHPVLASLTAPFARDPHRRYRMTRLPPFADVEP